MTWETKTRSEDTGVNAVCRQDATKMTILKKITSVYLNVKWKNVTN